MLGVVRLSLSQGQSQSITGRVFPCGCGSFVGEKTQASTANKRAVVIRVAEKEKEKEEEDERQAVVVYEFSIITIITRSLSL